MNEMILIGPLYWFIIIWDDSPYSRNLFLAQSDFVKIDGEGCS
jgi:hypothetical protein